ncbi:MAG: amino acid ABC transporter substrate-binding protein [Desulfobacterales bacterium]
MKRAETVLKFAVCVLLFVLFLAFPLTAQAKDKIVIGQAVSLSGPLGPSNAVVSTPYYDLWVKDVNAEGGMYVKELGKKLPVELLIYDDKSEIGKKLKDLKLPYFFQSLNFSETQVPLLASIFGELGVKQVAMIYHEDLHGVEYSGVAAPELAKSGIDVAMKKSYPMGVKDLSSLLKQAKSINVDALVGFSYPDECMLLTGQAIELGINFKVFALSVGPAFTFYRNAWGENTAEGIIGGGAWNPKSSPGAKQFAEHYRQVTGEEMGNYWGSIYFYSAMQHFKQAVEKAGTLDQKKIRDIMAKEKFDTALGPFWYDERQISANHPGEWGQWQKGVFEVIDPGPKRTAPPIPKPAWPKK